MNLQLFLVIKYSSIIPFCLYINSRNSKQIQHKEIVPNKNKLLENKNNTLLILSLNKITNPCEL